MTIKSWAKWDELAHDQFCEELEEDGLDLNNFVEAEMEVEDAKT